MEATQYSEAELKISACVDQLIIARTFSPDQKAQVLDVVFDPMSADEMFVDWNEEQSAAIQTLDFKYLYLKNRNKKSALFRLITSESNNLKRYLVTLDDLTARGVFDFSPVESH